MRHREIVGFAACIVVLALTVAGCSHDLTLPATGTVYGDLVYDDGSPAAGIVVVVEGTGLTEITDRNGRFVINGVLAVDEAGMGKYYTVRGYGQREGTSVGFLTDHFKVKGQQSYGLGTVTVRPTGSIIGAVLLSDDEDLSGVRVRIEGTSIETVTRLGGRYELRDVPPHEGYSILCSHPGYLSTEVTEMYDDGELVPVRVDPGEITNLGLSVLEAQR